MISNQVLQNTLEGLKEISRTEFCIIDTEGKVLATTFADFSIQPGDIQAFVESQAEIMYLVASVPIHILSK